MASFTGVGDNTGLTMKYRGEKVSIAISGTYNMTIVFQRQVGSPGSGAWENLRSYSTANATVADTYFTESENERVRLLVTVDTSGTATATLTDSTNKDLGGGITDRRGNDLLTFTEGGVKHMDMFLRRSPVVLTAAVTLTPEAHANRPLLLNNVAGVVVTLPAATGTGDVYEFIVVATLTSNAYTINATPNTDGFIGFAHVMDSGDATSSTFQTVATNDIITLTFADPSQGGAIGDRIKITDVSAGVWYAEVVTKGDAAQATPFAAT